MDDCTNELEHPLPVYIIDDEETMRRSLSLLMRSVGFHATCFSSARAFAAALGTLSPGCILLDLYMPDVTGQELQYQLRGAGVTWPVVVITGHGDVATAVKAMKDGAFDFVEKPFDPDALVDRIETACASYLDTTVTSAEAVAAATLIRQLTDRELEVLDQFVAGFRNKQVAATLQISTRTVEFHRKNIFRKLRAQTVSDAVRIAVLAGRPRDAMT